jgi:phage baseplate assembly protein W
LIDIKSKMPALITPQGVPTDSPISAAARVQMKEDLVTRIQELEVRVRLLEERTKEHR